MIQYRYRVVTRREAAQILDIPLEMAHRHGIPARLSEAELTELLDNPPAWLVQSKANRTSKRPVWVQLTCVVCGFSEAARPKKWWPQFTYVCCGLHGLADIPPVLPGQVRSEYEGIGSRFIGIVDLEVPVS
ncbi:putative membrane protein YhfC [Arthrobacter sp. CAN_A1]